MAEGSSPGWVHPPSVRRTPTLQVILGAIALTAFAWILTRLPAAPMHDAFSRLGARGLLTIAALQLLCFAADAGALMLCASEAAWDTGVAALGWTCFRACLTAQAVNTVTPLGQLGEGFKVRVLARHLPALSWAGPVLRHNYMLIASASFATALGVEAAAVILPSRARIPAQIVTVGCLFLAVVMTVLLVFGIGPRARAVFERIRRVPRLCRLATAIERLECDARASARDQPRLLMGVLLTFAKRVLLAVEGMLVLRALGCDGNVLLGVVSQASAQLIAWVTPFVPGQLGTAEIGSVMLFRSLGLAGQTALAFELIRRGRRLAFTAIGLAWVTAPAVRARIAGVRRHKPIRTAASA